MVPLLRFDRAKIIILALKEIPVQKKCVNVILPGGPYVQEPLPQVGLVRNNSDANRWQCAYGSQKGLIPPPQPSLPTVHISENRYKVGKVFDEDQLKQRQIKSILNKLMPQNFEKLFE